MQFLNILIWQNGSSCAKKTVALRKIIVGEMCSIEIFFIYIFLFKYTVLSEKEIPS